MSYHIFISYSKKDSDFALKLAEDLQEAGFKIWIDRTIGGGDKWRETIEKNLKAAEEVIIVVSPNSMASEWVKHEGSAAYAWEKQLIPILIEPVESLPPWLEDYQWIDFVDQSYETAFEALVEDLTPPNPIQDLLDQQVQAYQQTGALIGDAILQVILEGRGSLEINEEAKTLIQNSWKKRKKEKAEREAQRKRELEQAQKLAKTQRRGIVILALGLIATMVFGSATFFFFLQAESRRIEAENAQANAEDQARTARAGQLAALALNKLNVEHDLALLLSLEGIDLRDNAFSRDSLLTCVEHNPNLLRILQGHDNSVNSVVFSPDGEVLVSGSSDGTISFWNPYDGQQIGKSLTNNDGEIHSLAFSPDGDLLASGSDNNIIIWNYRNRKQLYECSIDKNENEYGPVNSIAFSPDGELIVGGYHDATIRLWNPNTGKLIREFEYGIKPINSVAFIQKGNVLISSDVLGGITSWDLYSGKHIYGDLRGYNFAMTQNGKYIATDEENSVILWNANTGDQINGVLTGHKDWVRALAFKPTGKILASGSDDSTIRFWDIHARDEVGQLLTAHNGSINSITFSPKGDIIVSGGEDGTIRVWVPPIEGQSYELLEDTHIRQTLADLSSNVASLDFGCVNTFEDSTDGCDQVLSSGSDDGEIHLWDVSTGKQIGRLSVHTDTVLSLSFNSDSTVLASGGCDGSIYFWDPTTHQSEGKFLAGNQDDCVMKIRYSPDGQLLACKCGFISIWDVSTGYKINQLNIHPGNVGDINFSPSGEWIVSSSGEGQSNIFSFSIWDLDRKDEIFHRDTGHMLWSILFSPTGNELVSGEDDGTIRFRDILSGDIIGDRIIAHTDFVSDLSFSPDGQFLVSGGADGAVKLWDPDSGQQIGETLAVHEESMWTKVAFSTDSRWLASAGDDGKIYLYDMVIESWKEKACELAGRNLTWQEWQTYLPNEPYRVTCPQWPDGEGVEEEK